VTIPSTFLTPPIFRLLIEDVGEDKEASIKTLRRETGESEKFAEDDRTAVFRNPLNLTDWQ